MFNWSLCVKHFRLKFFPKKGLGSDKYLVSSQALFSSLIRLSRVSHSHEIKKGLPRHKVRGFLSNDIFLSNFQQNKVRHRDKWWHKNWFIWGLFFWSMVFTSVVVELQAFWTPLLLVWKNIYWLLSVLVVCCLSCVQLANLII